jgi:hypothetical protein
MALSGHPVAYNAEEAGPKEKVSVRGSNANRTRSGQFGHALIAGVGHKRGDVALHILAFLGEERQALD